VRGIVVNFGEFHLAFDEILIVIQVAVVGGNSIVAASIVSLCHFLSGDQGFIKLFAVTRANYLDWILGVKQLLQGEREILQRRCGRLLHVYVALRRAGHAERIDADHWRVPADLLDRGQAYDLARDRANIRISILSPTGLDSQIGHDGATWLDRELASPSHTTPANTGFGREVTEAMERRRQSLVNMGHAVRLDNGRIRVSKDLIANLERTEVTRVGKAMAAERGLAFTAAKTGEYVSGTLVGSTQLASGRFAMIDDGIGFQLVPWQPVLDKRIGQHITGTVRDAGGIEWSFGRKRGLGL
jgi:hypothetical protein